MKDREGKKKQDNEERVRERYKRGISWERKSQTKKEKASGRQGKMRRRDDS